MKKTFALLLSLLAASSYCQENEKLIDLGKAYKNYMFMSDIPKEAMVRLKANTPAELQQTVKFISETLIPKNDLLKPEFLKLPDEKTLRQIYIVEAINYNVRDESQIDNNKLIDSLKTADISRNELIDTYYDILFTGVGNKIKPFDMKKVNFELNDYNLANDTEKGIFFLECMSLCGSTIWGYINVPKPPNFGEANKMIERFPKINGLNYYEYTDLNFPDFEIVIDPEKGKESYKGFYLNKYYETLIYHLLCIKKGFGSEKDYEKVLVGSILKDKSLYKYSKLKDILDDLFEVRKRD